MSPPHLEGSAGVCARRRESWLLAVRVYLELGHELIPGPERPDRHACDTCQLAAAVAFLVGIAAVSL